MKKTQQLCIHHWNSASGSVIMKLSYFQLISHILCSKSVLHQELCSNSHYKTFVVCTPWSSFVHYISSHLLFLSVKFDSCQEKRKESNWKEMDMLQRDRGDRVDFKPWRRALWGPKGSGFIGSLLGKKVL